MTDRSMALGVPVFQRTKKLRSLLQSAEDVPLDTVYVADNGHTEERTGLYKENWEFNLKVLDVEYDSGLGNCRHQIVEALEEDYLLITDSDHEIPHNVMTLVDQLEVCPDVGGVCGLLFENSSLRATCHDLYERGDILIRDIRAKNAKFVAGAPFIEFDFLNNVAVFRRECVEEYHWDPKLQQGKTHLDFYVGHFRQTDWRFGICPEVQFLHNPGGSTSYQSNRNSRRRITEAREYFMKKWGYRQIVFGQLEWLETHNQVPDGRSSFQSLLKALIYQLPIGTQARIMDLRLAIRRLRGDPPL